MKFSIFGLDFRINRKLEEKDKFSLSDTKVLNAQLVQKIKEIDDYTLCQRVSKISISDFSDLNRVKTALEEHGIVVVPEFVPSEILGRYDSLIKNIKCRVADFVGSGKRLVEEGDVVFQKGSEKISGYDDLSSYKKTIVQVREGQDEGMVDVFNVDNWIPELGEFLRPYFERLSTERLITYNGYPLQPRNLNIYVNASIKETRGFHVDSYKNEVKAFVYLSDVLDLADGPYTYVRGSHLGGVFRRVNMALSSDLPNSTEFPVVPFEDIVPVIAKKGALVISDQSGAHRGFPQLANRERMIAVMKYR